MSSGSLAAGTRNYTYTYNALGQRVGSGYSYLKGTSSLNPVQAGDVTAYSKKYYYDAFGRLIFETNTKTLYGEGTQSSDIVYLYDDSSVIGIEYTALNETNTYYFRRNLQGDVVGIYDTSGNLKVKYLYDAWGNCTVASETTDLALAKANPIRYRGYYYDEDTGLYFLNARYYSPVWRRFISPDDTAYLDSETPNGLNLYSYCGNDPVNFADPSGHSVSLIAGLIGLGFGLLGGLSYAAYTDYKDDNAINGSVGWQTYLGYGFLGAAVGGSIGFFGPSILTFMEKTFTLSLPTLGTLDVGGSLALAGYTTITITGVQIIGGAVVTTAGMGLLYMTYEGKKVAPRIRSNSKKKAYDKAYYKGGKNKPIHHPNGKYGPHYHPANPKFKHWHYYYILLLTLLGIDLEYSD